tara:strand:- start:41 stop:712 length:672 start_codon:yes stop_codon:yes gene_type:complete
MAINYKDLRLSVQKPGEEGKSHHFGLIPSDSSGVTIGVGFDIGKHSVRELEQIFKGNKGLIKKLSPYANKIGKAAKDYHDKYPLRLDPKGQDYLSVILTPIRYKIDKISSKYDKATGTEGSFANLDSIKQEIIFSTMYQLGYEDVPKKSGGYQKTGAPDFWKAAVTQDWDAFEKELLSSDWPSAALVRKNREGQRFKKWREDQTRKTMMPDEAIIDTIGRIQP